MSSSTPEIKPDTGGEGDKDNLLLSPDIPSVSILMGEISHTHHLARYSGSWQGQYNSRIHVHREGGKKKCRKNLKTHLIGIFPNCQAYQKRPEGGQTALPHCCPCLHQSLVHVRGPYPTAPMYLGGGAVSPSAPILLLPVGPETSQVCVGLATCCNLLIVI